MAPHSSTLAWKIPWMEEPDSCSPWGPCKSDMTEWLRFHFLLSCIGEGNGNPIQCSRLENPRNGGAWWAAIYGVTQSWTRLKWLSSSSSSSSRLKEKTKHFMWLRLRNVEEKIKCLSFLPPWEHQTRLLSSETLDSLSTCLGIVSLIPLLFF